jgi:hypothetical protein
MACCNSRTNPSACASDALNQVIEESTGKPRRVTDRRVEYLLAGHIRWPWPDIRGALETVLGRSIVDWASHLAVGCQPVTIDVGCRPCAREVRWIVAD